MNRTRFAYFPIMSRQMKNSTFSLLIIAVSIFITGCNQTAIEQRDGLQHPSAEVQVIPTTNEDTQILVSSSQRMSEQEIRLLRTQYETEVRGLKEVYENMLAEGFDMETIAHALHKKRRDIGIQYREITPADILEIIYNRNLERYGDKDGPTMEFLREQGRSWEDIIESAMRPGGRDLGL